MGKSRVSNINPSILIECRKQLNIPIDLVAKKNPKIPKIAAIEDKKAFPTYKQLSSLAKLYEVPAWVFIKEELPARFKFNSFPEFRKFSSLDSFSNFKVRKILITLERRRELFLEISEDINSAIEAFSPPKIPSNHNPADTAQEIRAWLGASTEQVYDFSTWRGLLEEKGIFIFLTSKFKGWSNIGKEVRGFAIYKETLPIILINDSDSYKAQSFTLFHELGHLLKKGNSLDSEIFGWDKQGKEELWCNEFAGSFLMPESSVLSLGLQISSLGDITYIKKQAKKLKVSPLAFAYRLLRLKKISSEIFARIKSDLDTEYQESRNNMGFMARKKRFKEVIQQYGERYARAMVQSYHEDEITLFKLSKFLDLPRPEDTLELIKSL